MFTVVYYIYKLDSVSCSETQDDQPYCLYCFIVRKRGLVNFLRNHCTHHTSGSGAADEVLTAGRDGWRVGAYWERRATVGAG